MLIAEIGQAHDGSLGLAHSYIDALSSTGIDAIKWQTHIAMAESSSKEAFRVNFSFEDNTRFDYWKRMEFSEEQWRGIKNHCEEVGLEFISSPFSNSAVDLLERIGVSRYKIGSGEVSNLLLLEKIARTGKPIILSSGLSSFDELDIAVNFLSKRATLSILQCYTAYPTIPSQWNLGMINVLKDRYKVEVGFSDHSGEIYACLGAAALGAEILEFHVVFDKRSFGPDSSSSLTINQVSKLVDGVNKIKTSLKSSNNTKRNTSDELKKMFGKSLAVNKDLPKGHIISFDDLESKKPMNEGLDAAHFKSIIGMRLKRNLHKWSFIGKDDTE